MNAHHRRRPDQAAPASQEAMSQEADADTTKTPTVAELWARRALVLGKMHYATDDDYSVFAEEQDEIEWSMVRAPSTFRYEVAHKLEAVLQYWSAFGPAPDRRDVLLLESAICDLSFESLK